MGKKRGFFDEIEASQRSSTNLVYILVLLGTILLWVYTAIPEQEKNAMIYMIMIIVCGIGLCIDITEKHIGKKKQLTYINDLGKKPLPAITAGFVACFAMVYFAPQSLIKPLAVVSPSILSFLFIVIAAPLAEASFFRGMLQPGLTYLFNQVVSDNFVAGCIATVVQSFAFAWFHVNIFGATGDWTPYFIFGMIATIGVYAMRSIGFEYGLHSLNNYAAWVGVVR